jgi:hypothetical protein
MEQFSAFYMRFNCGCFAHSSAARWFVICRAEATCNAGWCLEHNHAGEAKLSFERSLGKLLTAGYNLRKPSALTFGLLGKLTGYAMVLQRVS